jgi:hypothetical protein
MIEPRLIVSLLDEAAASDRFLETVHRLLPATRAGRIAVLRPPNPRLFGAVVRGAGPDAIVVVEDPRGLPPADMLRESPARWMAWCRDEDDVEQCGDDVIPVRADDVDSLAWEVVRRVAGDGGDAAPASLADDRPVPLSEQTDPVAGESGAPSHDNEIAGRREHADPPASRIKPPDWALGRADEQLSPRAADGGVGVGHVVHRPAPPIWAGGRVQLRDVPKTRALGPAAPVEAESWQEGDAGASIHDVPPLPQPLGDLRSPLARLASRLPSSASEGGDSPSGAGRTPSSTSNDVHVGRNRQALLRPAPSPSWLAGIRRSGFGWRARGASPPAELAGLGQDLVRCHSTVVLVGTSKGGPGKTTQAAAISLLGAQAVEPHGGSAVFVDANLNNPDAWKRLGLPPDAATVRGLVDALNRGATPPQGEMARDARLRVYPETRGGGTFYSAAEIDRLVHHLRLHHTVVVVDLPNVLPSLLEGPSEAVMAHWLRHADVFVLPVDLGAGSFVAAGEVLDALDELVATSVGLRMPGLVVPLLVPHGGGKVVRRPEVAELLDHFRDAGAAVVEVPQVIEVQVADHFKRPVIGASPQADAAFTRVLEAVVTVARSRGDGPDEAEGSG